ncbi:MAG: type III-A CRISPR-associated RAMP protein Csm5 [Desulfobacteraceae bacterium IS3]|nr:MAG: type III-A CRISPR-associated RAMP protein Csm5 [Desulfobacteraceae bacterium IS3]
MKTDKKIFRCFIKTLSPLYIGCDEIYEPMGFVIDETAKQMIVFDPISFFGQMKKEDKERFSKICLKGTPSSILEIYKFLKGRKAEGRRIDVCGGFIEHYQKTLSISVKDEKKIQQELNRFIIERTSFNPYDNRPYIPGSSVKGAIRTAYLNAMQQLKKIEKGSVRDAKDLEKSLLDWDKRGYDKIENDPFRLVKVSDFMPVGELKTKIVYAVNQKKKPSEFSARGIAQILEVIEPGAIFQGEIVIEQPEKEAGILKPVSLDNLLKSIALFYTKERKREDLELNHLGISNFSVASDSLLIRIGRHSGAESITIDGHRHIKITGKRGEVPKYLDHATTLWLISEMPNPRDISNLKPMGWVELDKLTSESEDKFKNQEQAWKDKRETEIKTRDTAVKTEDVKESRKQEPVPQKPLSALEKLLKELEVVKAGDMGRIGTFVQKIETLETDADKGALAKAVKEKMGQKQFKSYKRKEYLQGLIEKAK